MALSPTNNAAFLQEVDEAVRKDQLSSIMQRYGRWIVGAAIAALLAFGGYLYWEHRQTVARGEKAEQLLAAFDKAAAQPTAATADTSRRGCAGPTAAFCLSPSIWTSCATPKATSSPPEPCCAT